MITHKKVTSKKAAKEAKDQSHQKKPAWLAVSPSEYDKDETLERDELDSGSEDVFINKEEQSSEDVVVSTNLRAREMFTTWCNHCRSLSCPRANR